MKNLIILLGVMVLIGMSFSGPGVPPPTSEQLSELKKADPAIDTVAIQTGYNVFAEKCHKCHKLKDPSKFTSDELNKVLPKMAKKAKLTEEQASQVSTYALAFCKK